MNRFLLPLLLTLVVIAGVSRAADNVEKRLIAESNGDSYWLCIVETRQPDGSRSTAPTSTTNVRQRIDPVTGSWTQIASLQAKVIDAAPVDDRLAILLEGGEWRLLDQGGGAVGTSLPAPYQAISLASEGKTLLAIATPSGASTTQSATQASTLPAVPAVLRWSGSNWTRVADLPSDADPTHAVLATVDGAIHIAFAIDDTVHIRKLDGTTWAPLLTTPRKGSFKLLGNTPRVTIAQQDDAGAWTVSRPPSTQPVRVFEAKKVSDVVAIGPTLRLVFEEANQIKQLAFDESGAGQQFGPSRIAELPTAPTAQYWMHAVVVTLLILAMVATLRQKPPIPSEVLSQSMQSLAPLSRRFAAGMIDAIPLLAAGYYAQGNQLHNFDELQARWILPSFAGLAVWVLHIAICEAIWQRSLGKYLFGLRVTDYDGQPPALGRLALRNLMRVIDFSMVFLPLLLVPLTPMRQRVGDLAARTLVVIDKTAEEPPAE